MTGEVKTVPLESLVALHNELVGELAADTDKLNRLTKQHGRDVVEDDPAFNYGLGRRLGFRMGLLALQRLVAVEAPEQLELFDIPADPTLEEQGQQGRFDFPSLPPDLGDLGIA